MENIVVVGGGISGILSAILFGQRNKKVVLVEKEKELGGLLKSFQAKDNIWFDYGTHLLGETGVKELDDLLYGEINSNNYNIFEYPKAGNFFYKLNETSSHFNLNYINAEDYQKGMIEAIKSLN